MQRQQERITAGVEPTGQPSELMQIAVRSWLHFMRNACHQWLDSTETSRDEVRDLCAQTLWHAARSAGGLPPLSARRPGLT